MKYLSIIITTITLIFMLSFIFIPKKEFSENENRNLVSFPEFSFSNIIDGSYIKGIEDYINDHFPLRDNFMSLKTNVQLLLGFEEINDVYIGEEEYLFEKYNKPENTDKLINILNKFYENNNIDMDMILVPSSGLINNDLLPNNISFEQQNDVYEYFYENTLFNNIDVRNSLIKANELNQMYYRLDHHYTIYGAYQTYLEFSKSNDLETVELDTINLSNEFNGTLYSKTNIYNYEPDTLSAYIPNIDVKVNYNNKIVDSLFNQEHLNTKDKYAYFLDGNHPLMTIETNVNEEEILIIKDSYANSMIPFLTNHYGKIHVIDLRFYNLYVSDYIKENNIDKVLLLYSMTNIDNDTGIYKLK